MEQRSELARLVIRDLLEELSKAERHLASGAAHIERQRATLAELRHDGHDTRLALDLLRIYLESQHHHEVHRDRLQHELWEIAGEE